MPILNFIPLLIWALFFNFLHQLPYAIRKEAMPQDESEAGAKVNTIGILFWLAIGFIFTFSSL